MFWIVSIIMLYLAAVLGVGFYWQKRTKTAADYLIAGHRLGMIPAVGTHLGTFFSALSMLGGVGLIYTVGIGGSWFPMTWAAGAAIGPLLVYRLRRVKFVSAGEFFRTRYGSPGLQAAAGLMTIVGVTFMLIVQFSSMGIVWSLALGRSLTEGVILGAAVAVIYTLTGGFLAVAWTDVLQSLVFVVTISVGAVLVLARVGGVAELYSAAAAITTSPVVGAAATKAGSMLNLMGTLTPLVLFFTFLTQGPGTGAHPQYLVRAQAAGSMKIALSVYKYSWAILIFVYIALNIIGVGGRVLVPTMPQGMRPDWILPYLFLQFAHPIFTGLLFAGLLAAAMSTIDSQLLLVSASTSIDLAKNLLPGLSDRTVLWISRTMVLVVGTIVVVFSTTNLPLLVLVAGYSLGVIGLAYFTPVLLGLYWRRANVFGAWAGIIGGVGVFIYWQARYGTSLAGIPPIGPGILAGALLMWIVSMATKPSPESQWQPYFQEVRQPERAA